MREPVNTGVVLGDWCGAVVVVEVIETCGPADDVVIVSVVVEGAVLA